MGKTIIMLSAKRCGSTAIFRMFQRHPDVGVCHIDQDISNWEPNFWNLGAQAIAGNPQPMTERFKKSHPFLKIQGPVTEEHLFELWDSILDHLGPTVFDKSPQYLGNRTALGLIYKYKQLGNDVRVFSFIRDPRDAITSQYELWHSHVENDSPERREIAWLEKYKHLEELKNTFGDIPVFRYEDFSKSPSTYVPQLYKHCGAKDIPDTYTHISPVSVGRYSASINLKIREWNMGQDFKNHLIKYNYKTPQLDFAQRTKAFLIMLPRNIYRTIRGVFEKAKTP